MHPIGSVGRLIEINKNITNKTIIYLINLIILMNLCFYCLFCSVLLFLCKVKLCFYTLKEKKRELRLHDLFLKLNDNFINYQLTELNNLFIMLSNHEKSK